jgi:hypothetical protein
VEASLSFLGLGTAEPTPSWGLMLSGSAPLYAEKAPWMAIFPGLAISPAVFGFNLFGDSLRDALDPNLRHRPRSARLSHRGCAREYSLVFWDTRGQPKTLLRVVRRRNEHRGHDTT